jgi:glycerol kinase
VDGGFSKNEWYMRLLARAFPQVEVFAAEVAQASALGAALMVYDGDLPQNLIQLKRY